MEISERAVSSLAIATVHLVAAVVLTTLLGRVRKLSIANWLVILWLTYDVIVHVTLVC